ncbi:phosphoserine aminotransferase isoform X2 [Tachypleus tridentatus]|uniref:phosphoserine aminotransferase isoform X2 n=1 Tax=Tachypleus tridentatus TaxID=6853 RepID=UPI003FD1B5A8
MSQTKNRVINFSAGPAKLPMEVLETAQDELIHYRDHGVSVMELSHRSTQFSTIMQEAKKDLRDLLNIPENYDILFLQGGGTGQFSAVPMNLCATTDSVADYLITGSWSLKATKEGEKYCRVNKVLPSLDAYNGVEFNFIPETGDIPLITDMSSNILTRPVDVSKYGIIFAGAQKNIGIAGATVVIIRDDLVGHAMPFCPSILDYKLNLQNNSVYNTPSTFSIYIMNLVFKWIKKQGGAEAMGERSQVKSKLVYDVIDSSDFYYSSIFPKDRSRVNIPFRIGGSKGNEYLEKKFLDEAHKRGMVSLKGHRSVGGIRASLFNAITVDEVEHLSNFMKEFRDKHRQ